MAYNDMPDVGTLGGTMSDPNEENSATMGGGLSPAQNAANQEVNDNSWGYDFGAAGFNDPGEWSLGSLFGNDQQTGLPTYSGDYVGTQNYGFSDFADSPFGKGLRGLLGLTPFGRIANMGIDAFRGKSPVSIAMGAIPGMPGVAARAGYSAYNSKDPTASLGRSAANFGLGTAGRTIGTAVGGPVGGMIGGMLPGLAGLYSGYQGLKQADQLSENAGNTNQALQGQMTSLAGMYGQDSPYAQQLKQTLARKDAAAGRNSQYGPRAANLQAQLASMAPQVANSMSSLANAGNSSNRQAQEANLAKQMAQGQILNKLLGLGQSTGFNDWASQGLSSLFSGGQSQAPEYDSYQG